MRENPIDAPVGATVTHLGRKAARINLGGRPYLVALANEGATEDDPYGAQFTFDEARARYPQRGRDGGVWRLPTRDELSEFAEGTLGKPGPMAYLPCRKEFPSDGLPFEVYWTGEPCDEYEARCLVVKRTGDGTDRTACTDMEVHRFTKGRIRLFMALRTEGRDVLRFYRDDSPAEDVHMLCPDEGEAMLTVSEHVAQRLEAGDRRGWNILADTVARLAAQDPTGTLERELLDVVERWKD